MTHGSSPRLAVNALEEELPEVAAFCRDGQGTQDWGALVDAWRKHVPRAVVVECDRLEANRRSLGALRRLVAATGDP